MNKLMNINGFDTDKRYSMIIGVRDDVDADDYNLYLHDDNRDSIMKVAKALSTHCSIWVCDHEITDDEPGIYCNY